MHIIFYWGKGKEEVEKYEEERAFSLLDTLDTGKLFLSKRKKNLILQERKYQLELGTKEKHQL